MSFLKRLYPARAYLSYWLTAVDEHSLHSPFLFKFYNEVVKRGDFPTLSDPIEKRRRELLHNSSLITLNDPGEGSLVSSSEQRTVRSIARHSLSSPAFCRLLYRLVKFANPAEILELGTSFGISAAYMAGGAPDARITTMEGSPAIAAIARKTFDQLELGWVSALEGEIAELLPRYINQIELLDFAFLDAHHNETATLAYFETLLPRLHSSSVVVLGDIHWSAGMERAWQTLTQHPAVTLSVDLFDAGILFFNKDLRRETETLRV